MSASRTAVLELVQQGGAATKLKAARKAKVDNVAETSKTDSYELSVSMDAEIAAQEQAGQDLENIDEEEADEIFQQRLGAEYQSELRRLRRGHALEEVKQAAGSQQS